MESPRLSQASRALRLAAVSAFAVLGGCNMVVMNPTGDIALQERNLILIATGLMLLIIVPVMALTALFAWRYRTGNKSAAYDPEFDHSTPLELIIWACPLLIIICLGAVTWSSTHLLDPFRPLDRIAAGRPVPAGVQPLEVQVVAMDWKWLFIYPKQGIATVNELVLPVDVPVHFSITSTSQMNTFYAPTLAGMIYAMPGMQSVLNAVLNKPGSSWGYSGNYTGRGFSDMRFQLHGVDQAGFDRWAAQTKAGGGTLSPATYGVLEVPSEKTPVQRFAAVSPGLFSRVVNRCVKPGEICLADMMRHDAQAGREGSVPLPMGAKPHGALEQSPAEIQPGLHLTAPAKPGTPGKTKPGDPRNRNLSAIVPFHAPGAVRAARA